MEKELIMQAVAMQAAEEDVRSFVEGFLASWTGTDENKILAYYSDDIVLHVPTGTLKGKTEVRDNFVRPFITAFPGNVNVIVNLAYGKNLVAVDGALKVCIQAPLGTLRPQENRSGFRAAHSTHTTSQPE